MDWLDQLVPQKRKPAASNSAVHQAAEKMRNDAFELPDGAFLGSEEDLILRYSASRPTVRQAAGLVIQEQLLEARRGIGGGFFIRRPNPDVVTHTVSQFFRCGNIGVKELAEAARPIRIEIARLAALSTDEQARATIAEFLVREKEADEQPDFERFLRVERAFNHLLGALSGSTALSLFLQILLDLASMVHREQDIYGRHPERRTLYRRERLRLAEAVIARDPDTAAAAAAQCAAMSHQWLIEGTEQPAEAQSAPASDSHHLS